MSKVALSGNASGTGTFTIASPNSNTDRTLSLPDASGTAALTSDVLGIGQTWTNVTGSRVLGTTYTNSTTKPITVVVGTQAAGAGAYYITVTIGGVALPYHGSNSNTGSYLAITFIVPAGVTYVVANTTNALLSNTGNNWVELR